jgi:hypothetical protein
MCPGLRRDSGRVRFGFGRASTEGAGADDREEIDKPEAKGMSVKTIGSW